MKEVFMFKVGSFIKLTVRVDLRCNYNKNRGKPVKIIEIDEYDKDMPYLIETESGDMYWIYANEVLLGGVYV